MRRARWLAIAALLEACYSVSDLNPHDAAPIGSGGVAEDAFTDTAFPGGTAGSGGAAGSADTDASDAADADIVDAKDAANTPDVKDAKADVVDAPQPVGNWTSCTTLKYKGACLGANQITVMYYDDPATCNSDGVDYICYVSQCKLKSGSCSLDPTCGWDCDPKLDPTSVQHCGSELAGKCVDGVAIKADTSDSKNCYFKECQKLGATCQVKSNGADCY